MRSLRSTTTYFIWKFMYVVYIALCFITLVKFSTPFLNEHYLSKENFIVKYTNDKMQVKHASLQWSGLSPSLVLHDATISQISHDNLEHVSKIFAVVDLWRSLLFWKLSLSKIIINDVTLNLSSSNDYNIKDINDLQKLLPRAHYKKFNLHFGSFRIKNLIIKQKDNIIKLKDVRYVSSIYKNILSFYAYELSGYNLKAKASLINYKDNLGNIIAASYNLDSNGTYPSYLLKDKLKNINGKVAVKYNWKEGFKPSINIDHDISANKLILKGKSLITINSSDSYSIRGILDQLKYNDAILKKSSYNFITSSIEGDELRLQHIDLSSVRKLAKMILQYNIPNDFGGIVKDLYLSGYNFIDKPDIKVARANILGFKIFPSDNYPAIDALDVKFKYLDGAGEAILHGDDIAISAPNMFKKPQHIKVKAAKLNFNKLENNSWKLALPQMIASYNGNDFTSELAMLIENNKHPEITGRIRANNIDILSMQELLGAKSLNLKFRNWLKSAVKRGRFNDILLDIEPSGFVLKGDFDNFDLHFAKSWPQLENIAGKLYLDQNKFELLSSCAIMKAQAIDKIELVISDWHNPNIDLSINSNLDLAKAKSIVDNSSLHESLGAYFSGAEISGDAELKLGLTLSSAMHFNPEKVSGTLALKPAAISWPKFHFALTEATGSLSFHNFDVISNDLVAFYHKDKVNILAKSENSSVRVNIDGSLDANSIANEYLPEVIAGHIVGDAKFQASLNIKSGAPLEGSLDVTTDGVGIDINYPLPLAKPKDLDRHMYFKAIFSKDSVDYKASLASDISIVAKNKADSIKVYLNTLDLDPWSRHFLKSGKIAAPNVTIFAKNLIWKAESFKNVKAQITEKSGKLAVNLSSKKITGKIDYFADNMVKASLDHLYLSSGFTRGLNEGNNEMLYDVMIKKLVLGGYYFKNVGAIVKNSGKNEHKIKKLKFKYKNSSFDLKGALASGSSPKSMLEGKVLSTNFSELFSYIPSLHNFDKGSGEINFYITWPDLVNKFSPKMSSAMLDMNIKNGQIVDIGEQATKDLEASKVLNFLSMKSIMQNLSSGDRDDKSYTFEKIQGDLLYSNGVLNTEKILLKGDFGSAYVKGDINLKSHTYDLYMTVMPIITSSIPTIAALAGGVFAGFIAWTASQIVENPLSEIAMKVYKISGSMENPTVVELEEQTQEKELEAA